MPKIESVKFGQIGWLYEHNIRSNSWLDPLADLNLTSSSPANAIALAAKMKGLCRTMQSGWESNQGVVTVIPIAAYAKMHDQTVAEVTEQVIAERERLLSIWENDERYKHLACTVRKLWVGKVLYIANNSNRRSWGVIGAVDIRSRQSDFDGRYEYDIPVSVKEFPTKEAMIAEHLLENTLKDVGRSGLTLPDLSMAARKLLGLNQDFTESALMDMSGSSRGSAQQAHRLAKFDLQFPSLDVVKRISLPETDINYLPYGSLGKELVYRVNNGFHWDDKPQTGTKAIGSDALKLATAFIDQIKVTGKATVTKMMSAPDIGEKLGKSPCYLLNFIAEAITKNNAAYFIKFSDPLISEQLNKLTKELGLTN